MAGHAVDRPLFILLIKLVIIKFVMNLEAKETARLYSVLTEKLGGETAEAMFRYIDNKTERSVEATIKTLATKEDLAQVKYELSHEIGDVRKEMSDIRKEIGESKADTIKWMFIFWIGQVASTLGIILLYVKK
jgi:hypothetical protein